MCTPFSGLPGQSPGFEIFDPKAAVMDRGKPNEE